MIDPLVPVPIKNESIIRREFIGIDHRILLLNDLLNNRKERLSLSIFDDFCVDRAIVPLLNPKDGDLIFCTSSSFSSFISLSLFLHATKV